MLGIKEIIVLIYQMELGNKNTNQQNNTTTKHLEVTVIKDKQIPAALGFLHRDESGVFNEVDIVQAMDGYAKLHVERVKQFLYEEICERRPYSSSKMCEEVLKFIDQMDNN
jgi:hypothetical protein